MFCLKQTVANLDRVGTDEDAFAANEFDFSSEHGGFETRRNILDEIFFAIDQRGPVQLGLSDRNTMQARALDFMKRMTRLRPEPSSAYSRGLGQVPPISRGSIIATDIPAARVGPCRADTPHFLPPPRIATSNFRWSLGRLASR